MWRDSRPEIYAADLGTLFTLLKERRIAPPSVRASHFKKLRTHISCSTAVESLGRSYSTIEHLSSPKRPYKAGILIQGESGIFGKL
jgi:hypothetical protein